MTSPPVLGSVHLARVILAIVAAGLVMILLNTRFGWMFEYHKLEKDGKLGYVFGLGQRPTPI